MNDRFLRALRGETVDRTPVWFMRQAGRYLPEYRRLRGDRDILETIRDPGAAVEISLQPLRRMALDAAIAFGDIMTPLAAVGLEIRIEAGRGPVVADPIRSASDLARLRPLEPEVDEPFVLETVRELRSATTVPVIGFAGAPFTLASYLVEGGPSRDHARTKALMLGDPDTWAALMDALASIARAHLLAQIDAGAQAIQLFDSWAGALAPDPYRSHVQPWSGRVLRDLPVPSIHFGVGTGELLGAMRETGGDAIGVDWRVPIDVAWDRVGAGTSVQGNLDPATCLAPWDVISEAADDVLDRVGMRDGHVFNLGHGVLPGTPVEHLQRLVDHVHERTDRSRWTVRTTA